MSTECRNRQSACTPPPRPTVNWLECPELQHSSKGRCAGPADVIVLNDDDDDGDDDDERGGSSSSGSGGARVGDVEPVAPSDATTPACRSREGSDVFPATEDLAYYVRGFATAVSALTSSPDYHAMTTDEEKATVSESSDVLICLRWLYSPPPPLTCVVALVGICCV
jgi:hypothetical protein